ncbi:MAG: response regulator [Pseudomonadota bacterium]
MIRSRLKALGEKRRLGDLTERAFLREVAEAINAHFLELVKRRLGPGERVLAVHHVVRGHLKLNRSVLRELDEENTSLYLTDRRLVRVSAVTQAPTSRSSPTLPASARVRIAPGVDPLPDNPLIDREREREHEHEDRRDGNCVRSEWHPDLFEPRIDELPLSRVRGLRSRREIRRSEIVAGLVVVLVSLVFAPILLMTGTLLLALGCLAVLHGLLMPTRWFEIEPSLGTKIDPPLQILAPRKTSARQLVRALCETIVATAQGRCQASDSKTTTESARDQHDRAGTSTSASTSTSCREAPRRNARSPEGGDAPQEAVGEQHSDGAFGQSLLAIEPGEQPGEQPDEQIEERRLSVLVIDDEVVFRETLAKVLGRHGISAIIAVDGEDGLALLAREQVDVITLDLRMPGLDGLSTLRRIRETKPCVPVILLTGHGTAEAGLAAIREQAFNFLLKPIAPEQLIEEIRAAAAVGAVGAAGAVGRDRARS